MSYNILIRLLDTLRVEAPKSYKSYHPDISKPEKLHSARSKSLIHLFLKAKFGLLTFSDRIKYITDDTGDGGIDGYFLDEKNEIFYLIQSKLKATEAGSKEKSITADELLKMEISRILGGKKNDSGGSKYNDKILAMQSAWCTINDQPKYKLLVIILGNLHRYNDEQIKRLIDNLDYEIYNYADIYKELVFPLCSGMHYDPDEITITLDLGNKDQSILKQSVTTKYGDFHVRVVFVPVAEIGRILSQYKNSILKFNPRNFLTLSKNTVNKKIMESILDGTTNDFSILNNGITILCEKFESSEKVGEIDTGKIIITQPQIINGGQTAYTLSIVFDKYFETNPEYLHNKEVLLRAVVVPGESENDIDRFISEISNATNQQTDVKEADRRSNSEIQIVLQNKIFESFGYFYERKTGQYFSGVENGYIKSDEIIDRNMFIRSYYAFQGNPRSARTTAENYLFRETRFNSILNNTDDFNKMLFSYNLLRRLYHIEKTGSTSEWGSGLRYGKMAIIYAIALSESSFEITPENIDKLITDKITSIKPDWLKFENSMRRRKVNKKYKDDVNRDFDFNSYYKGSTIEQNLKLYFSPKKNEKN